MVEHVKSGLEGVEGGLEEVRVLVIGALGRCGSGAVDLFRKVGIKEWVFQLSDCAQWHETVADLLRENIIKWDMAETAKGGPFQEILDGKLTQY